ncbi:protein arginine N-methyltransferase 2-like [Babylonia areolata]|uniref:protein arginine N-methyltransferase 2-like n=1 Tax=Babylonia areolata TaxID=304850 RepID=UPI003FD3561D
MADEAEDDEVTLKNKDSFQVDGDVSDELAALALNGPENGEEETEEIVYAVADYTGVGENQLSFSQGETLKILKKNSEHWWWAESSQGMVGYVPVNHLTHNSNQQFFWEDDEYFGSYGKLKLHHEMLSDQPRTLAYQRAIKDNAAWLKDKVILDVGCGTGILSLMCAKYGQPKQVYAVEASDMADYTQGVVDSNGLSDVISVRHSYVEDLSLETPVDLIISEWMGTLLLFEMMVESVLIARDKFLAPGGTVWPSSASLFLVPVTADEQYRDYIDCWCHQYGFDLSYLKSLAVSEFLPKPFHSYELQRDTCLAPEATLLQLDLASLQVSQLEDIICPFQFQVHTSGTMHGFCTWFQVDFCGLGEGEGEGGVVATTSLNTGPDHELTHWKQNLFLLDEGVRVTAGDLLQGRAQIYRHKDWRRHLRMLLTFTHRGQAAGQCAEYEKLFYIWR